METQKQAQELTTEELRALLQAKEQEEKEARQQERKKYEEDRDFFVRDVMINAVDLHVALKTFKERLHEGFDEHQEKLNEYGAIRANSKGGFSITTSDGMIRIKRVRSTMPQWDERSDKALELISDFLRDTVKKKDIKLFEILFSFIQKNEKGDLEYAKVMHLLQHKDKYNDPRWLEGLELIQESYNVQLRGYGYEFYSKNEITGKFEKIEINFTAL